MKARIETIISYATREGTNTMKTVQLFQHRYEAVTVFNKVVIDWSKGYSTHICCDENIAEATFECAGNGCKKTITIKVE